MGWGGGRMAAHCHVTLGTVRVATGRALGWVAVKSHLIAVSHLNSPENRLLHSDVLGPPGSSQGIQS